MKFTEVKLPSNRKFGLLFSFVFMLAAAYLFWNDLVLGGSLAAGIGCIFLLVTIIKDDLLLPLNKLWMRLGFLLHLIVSPIVLGTIYFLIFTPTAFAMRLFGRDALGLKKQQLKTNWKPRDTSGQERVSFKQQF